MNYTRKCLSALALHRRIAGAVIGVLSLAALLLLMTPGSSFAASLQDPGNPTAMEAAPLPLELPVNGTIEVPVYGHCMNRQ